MQKKKLIDNDKQYFFSPYLILPNNKTIIATKNNHVIGTISLIEDSPIGIPMDNVHPNETADLRRKNVKFAEIGSFAVTPEYQHHGITLLLYKAIFLYVSTHRSIESILIAVHPRVAGFYKDLFKFEQIGTVKKYSTFNNAESIPLIVNICDSMKIIKKNKTFNKKEVKIEYLFNHNYDFSPYKQNSMDNDFKYIPIWKTSQVQKYFNKCDVKIDNLPKKQKAVISWLYPTLN